MNTATDNAPAPPPAPHMDELRGHLMATLASLRDRANPMEPDRARAIAQVAAVLVDTAKVEVDYLKATHGDNSRFLGTEPPPPGSTPPPAIANQFGAHNPWPGTVRQHKLEG